MAKIEHDKYYTSKELARYCMEKTKEVLGEGVVKEIIEPSAGAGSFSLQIKNCIAYDLVPEHPSIIKQDFLELDIPYKEGRLFIGNPPFGKSNTLSVQFFKKCVKLGDYIAFLLPISQLNNNSQMYDFDLIHSEDVGEHYYSGVLLRLCFNIYRRPLNGQLNKKEKIILKDVTIYDYRRDGRPLNIPKGYDYAMGVFGGGCIGKELKEEGQFSSEFYIYIHKNKETILKFIKEFDWKSYCKGTSNTYRLSQEKFFKVLIANIEGIE